METLVQIAHMVLKYVKGLQDNKNLPLNKRKTVFAQLKNSFVSDLKQYMDANPELMQLSIADTTSFESDSLKKTIADNANKRYSLPVIPICGVFSDIVEIEKDFDSIERQLIVTPKYVQPGNIVLQYERSNQKKAFDSLGSLLFNMILMLPVGKVKFHIVNFSAYKDLDEFLKAVPSSLYYNEVIRDKVGLNRLLVEMSKKADSTIRGCKDVIIYNEERKKIRQPYEVLVLLDDAQNYSPLKDDLSNLCRLGSKAGIYTIFLSTTEELQFKADSVYDADSEFDDLSFYLKDTPSLVSYNPFWLNAQMREACLDYIVHSIESVQENSVQSTDFKSLPSCYLPLDGEMKFPVGEGMVFRLNTVDHIHAFIIGQSGSGKSVFLHNIIGSAIQLYSPEDLQLYLLDFKIGGVEFNRYRGMKHIKAMLIDNSDQQITLEILRELRENMTVRGRTLRNAGVTNIVEYNNEHADNKMAHILVVADECHELFRNDNSIPRNVSNEINDIITKIAKEGRNQGVHLIFATQTLSGAEISNEILNNISDHYLLKCASTDSDRMVPGSSDITSMQTTGQIYYHHVEEQQQFQAFYTPREDAEKLVEQSKEKAKDHKSNGEFYFNGAQVFTFETEVLKENKKISKIPVAYLGKSIDLKQKDVCINLKEDYSENILVMGLNDDQMVTRTTFNILHSMIATSQIGKLNVSIKVINCMSDDDSIYEDTLNDLENADYCDVIPIRERGAFLKKLAEEIKQEKAEPTVLFILGQEKFRELKMDLEIKDKENLQTDSSDFSSMLGAFSSNGGSTRSFKQTLDVILDNGPEFGVHTVIQVDKPVNLLFEDLTAKEVFRKFKHLVMLKSDEMTAGRLFLKDEIRLETLSKDPDRLRAYYYADESDTYTLFTPYMITKNSIIEQLKTI